MKHHKYICITVSIIPEEFINEYNLHIKVYNGYVYAKVLKMN